MARHSSATTREHTPHVNQTTRTATVLDALKRRAQAVLNDKSIDPQTRAIIRYGLETNDPWLAELVRRADAGETVDADTIDSLQTPNASEVDSWEEKIQALTDIICREGDEAGTKSAALLVLMAAIENSAHPKAVANATKHFAFNQCGQLNLCGVVDAQIAVLEGQLLAGDAPVF